MNARKSRSGLAALLALAAAAIAPDAGSVLGPGQRVSRVADAITEIDLAPAEKLLAEAGAESRALSFERARLSVYRGDCDAASATLSSPDLRETKEGASLAALAESCARATVAGFVLEDQARGVWLRLQDDADRALAPYLFDVAARARDAVTRQLGVDLPRPLRIDLVRDQFSLSAVSGLPLAAAETTGTLAVARWGRVIMLSPRAAALGFPWEDTLAHEITHLVVTRATRDYAPLWLQEGLAKRLEASWRDPRPFDDPGWADSLAQRALLGGHSVGIDKLGPSIAMLPTPDAASIAFAEVTSFIGYFVREAGHSALRLLLADLKGIGARSPEPALRSVTGLSLSEWNSRWQKDLAARTDTPGARPHRPPVARDAARRARLSELLLDQGRAESAAEVIEPAIVPDLLDPSLRFRAARAQLDAGQAEKARQSLGTLSEIGSVYGAWFALHGRFLREQGELAEAERAFAVGIAVDPLSEDVACEGERSRGAPDPKLPAAAERSALCRAARERLRH
jgi:tetratricopeptide (TPR) repeat protein